MPQAFLQFQIRPEWLLSFGSQCESGKYTKQVLKSLCCGLLGGKRCLVLADDVKYFSARDVWIGVAHRSTEDMDWTLAGGVKTEPVISEPLTASSGPSARSVIL